MAVVSVALVLSFHLKQKPTETELRMAKPLRSCILDPIGSLSCAWAGELHQLSRIHFHALEGGLVSFLILTDRSETVNKYSRKQALVQTGWKTQSVSLLLL